MRTVLFSGILFLSGCGALLFQTLWLRLSGLAFGNSVWSTALILSSFMAGMALGNGLAAFGRLPRVRPLRLYVALELIVAIAGCTVVFGLPGLGQTLRPIFQLLWDHQAALNGLRFTLSFAILLLPSTAIGLTLPVLLSDPWLARETFGKALGLLYGANTLGAVLGALAGEQYLIRAVGLRGTGFAAAGMDVAAAVLALAVGMAAKRDEPSPAAQAITRPAKGAYRPARRFLIGTFGSGCLFLCLEVVWFRFLRLYISSSAAAFAIMLAIVLAGLGLGGLAAGLLHRCFSRERFPLSALFLTAALTTLASYLLFPIPAAKPATSAFYLESPRQIVWLSIALMFPVSFLSGLLFPVLVNAVQSRVGSRLNSTGMATLLNTLGAALGPLLASFLLLPHAGFQTSLILCAAGYVALAAIVTPPRAWSPRGFGGASSMALAAGWILLIVFFPYSRAERHFANARRPYEADGSRLVRKIEGTADTEQLLRRDLYGQPYYYRLLTNGFSMSATHPRSQRYMRLFAYLPLLFHPQAENALLICYGVGVTADALTLAPQLKRIDIVDISREVFALAPDYKTETAGNPLHDPRVHAFVQDGRFFLQATPRQYDIITGEPPPLKVAGTVNLYTREFFSRMKARLTPDGVASFWLPIYQLRVPETEAILKAFHEVFPNASVWGGSDDEWIMIGINGPGQTLAEDDLHRPWTNPRIRADLERIGIEQPRQFAALFLMDAAAIDQATAGVAPLTDLYPKRLTDRAPDSTATFKFAWPYIKSSEAYSRFLTSDFTARVWPDSLKYAVQSDFLTREIRFLATVNNANWLAELDYFLHKTQLRRPVLSVLNSDETRVLLAKRIAKQSGVDRAAARPDLLADALAGRDYAGAVDLLENERASGFKNPNDFYLLAYLLCLTGRVHEAEQLAHAASQSLTRDPLGVWLWKKLAADYGFRPPP